MFTKRNLSAVAFAVAIAAPLSAQVVGGSASEAAQARRRAEEARQRTGAVLTRARIDSALRSRGQTSRNQNTRIPPGQLPPRGMCRVWIDGVPPGQQPAVTSCAQAEQDRLRHGTNARVIYGDTQSFPGRGQGKFKNRGTETQNAACVYRDAVVVGDRVVNVCRDAAGNVINQRGRAGRHGDDNDDDLLENGDRGRSSAAKAAKLERKAARKGRGK
jgi:hypothetical protein